MDIKAYIESGIIEQFVMGETNEAQTREVMAYARQYPEIKAEIEAVENTLIQLAEAGSREPKTHTADKLFAEVFKDQNNSQTVSTPVVPMKSASMYRTYLAAASIALLISVGMNIFQYGRLRQSEDQLLAINAEKAEYAANMKAQQASYSQLKKEMDEMMSPDMVQVKLGGMGSMPDAKAVVYYNMKNGEVHMHLNHLPQAPEGKQYQLWAIVDGQPVDAGVFDSGEEGMMNMKASRKPGMFAVTIEKMGGSVAPTMDQMVLAGKFPS